MSYRAIRPTVVRSSFVLTQLLFATQYLSAQTTTKDGAYTLAGQCADVLASFVATSSSVTINNLVSGPITFALDPTQTSTTTWDFTHKTETWDLYLTANSPLIASLTTPIPFHITETGALPALNLATLGSLNWSGSQSGTINGAATSGNASGTFNDPGASGINIAFDQSGPLTGSSTISEGLIFLAFQDRLTIAAGNQSLLKGSNFTVVATGVPEANTLAIAMIGFTGLGLLARRRRRQG